MGFPVTVTDAVVAMVLFFNGLCAITLGMMALGKGKPDGAGTVFKLCSIPMAILGVFVIWAFLGVAPPVGPIYVACGFLFFIFAIAWAAAGIINTDKFDLMPLGNAFILCGLMQLAYAYFFGYLGAKGILTGIGAAWLVINTVSWAWLFFSVTLASHGKLSLSAVGWTAVAEAFYTLWIPAALLLTGAFSLLPK